MKPLRRSKHILKRVRGEGAPTSRDNLLAALARCGGSVVKLARQMRVSRQAIWHHVQKFGLEGEIRRMIDEGIRRGREARARPPKPRRPIFTAPLLEGGRFTEEEVLVDLMERHYGRVADAAREVGVHRSQVWAALKRLALVERVRQIRLAARATYDLA